MNHRIETVQLGIRISKRAIDEIHKLYSKDKEYTNLNRFTCNYIRNVLYEKLSKNKEIKESIKD